MKIFAIGSNFGVVKNQQKQNVAKPLCFTAGGLQGDVLELGNTSPKKDELSKVVYRNLADDEYDSSSFFKEDDRLFVTLGKRKVPYNHACDEYRGDEIVRTINYADGYKFMEVNFEDEVVKTMEIFDVNAQNKADKEKRTKVRVFENGKETLNIERMGGKYWEKAPRVDLTKYSGDTVFHIHAKPATEDSLGSFSITKRNSENEETYSLLHKKDGTFRALSRNGAGKCDLRALHLGLQILDKTIHSKEYEDFGTSPVLNEALSGAIEFLEKRQ